MGPPQRHMDPYGAVGPSHVLRVRKTGLVVLAYPDDEQADDPEWYPLYNDSELLDDLTDDWAMSPVPPGEDSLTVEDLREAEQVFEWLAQRHEAEDAEPVERDFYAFGYRDLAGRLRRAIEQATR